MGDHICICSQGKVVDNPENHVAEHDAPHATCIFLDDGKGKQHGTGANYQIGPTFEHDAGASDVG